MLPSVFYPEFCVPLKRYGSKHDGGYVVWEPSITDSDFLLSFGVERNIRFEVSFLKKKKLPVLMYDDTVDPSLSKEEFLGPQLEAYKRRFIDDLTRRMERGHALSSARLAFRGVRKYRKMQKGRKVARFLSFFKRENVSFVKQRVGGPNGVSFSDILKKCGSSSKIFLKIDIEGSEFSIIDEIMAAQSRITALVIEFHDCIKMRARIERFIKEFELDLVHIHGNNNAPIVEGFPEVLEMTFARLPRAARGRSNRASYPIRGLDAPCHAERPDYRLHFQKDL